MAILTLVTINHDRADVIDSDEFRCALVRYMMNPGRQTAEDLLSFGVVVHGMSHHDDWRTRGFRSFFEKCWYKLAKHETVLARSKEA